MGITQTYSLHIMLLGTTNNYHSTPNQELLILHLLLQNRYAEAYELLSKQQPANTCVYYNLALCLHWSGNFEAALNQLDKIQLAPRMGQANLPNTDTGYKLIKSKQDQTDDYLNGISETYIQIFPGLFHDAIIRLKTDCWLMLNNYNKVIAIASPIAYKGYKDITHALKLAETANEQRI